MSAAATSAKHENCVCHEYFTHSASRQQGGDKPPDTTLLMEIVYLGGLKAPRKATGQMDLLTVPSVDSVDSKVRYRSRRLWLMIHVNDTSW